MKKILLLVALSLLLCVNVNVSAKEEKEWDLDESRKRYDINVTEIKKMDTKELLSNVLENPYLVDLLAYDDISVALNKLIDEYESIKELYGRDDLVYAFMNQHSKQSKNKLGIKVVLVNLLMAYSSFIETCNNNQKKLLNDLIISNIAQYFEEDTIINYSLNVASLRFDMEPFEVSHTNCSYQTTVYTYSGSSVSLCIVADNVHSMSTVRSLQDMVTESYPNAVELEIPNLQYNCHSFAWHFGSQSNLTNMRGVIHAPSIYITDGSYTQQQTANLLNGEEYKVAYMQGETLTHSGVVESYNGNNIEVVSKWGVLGLYRHKIDETPYDNCVYKFYKHTTHFYEYSANTNGLTHKCICRCNYTCDEPHEFIMLNGNYKCSKCDYIFQTSKVGGN